MLTDRQREPAILVIVKAQAAPQDSRMEVSAVPPEAAVFIDKPIRVLVQAATFGR